MLEYLKSVISEQLNEQNGMIEQEPEIDDSTILEYASVFQELDDLSVKGTAIETAVRTPISIPLDDDIELDSIEINLTDGRVTDIPADATVQEQEEIEAEKTIQEFAKIEQQYTAMKTYDDFYAEAYHSLEQYPRESDERFDARVRKRADSNWYNYNKQLYQEGVFGHSTISLNDLNVPDRIPMDFGPTSESNKKEYSVVLPVYWEVNRSKCITKKQLDSVYVYSKMPGSMLDGFTNEIFKMVKEEYNIPDKKSKWDVLTPTAIYVPIKPEDSYAIDFIFDADFTKEELAYSISIKCKYLLDMIETSTEESDMRKITSKDIPKNVSADIKKNKSDLGKNFVRKRDYVVEHANDIPEDIPVRHSRFWQEAIDFGDDAPADTGAPAPENTENNAPTLDATADTSTDTSTDTNASADIQPSPDAANAAVNDVSDQIADKVSQTTEKQTDDLEGDTPSTDVDIDIDSTPTDTSADTSTDTGTDNAGDVDADIEALDNAGNDAAASETPDLEGDTPSTLSDADMDNMTIDELLAQGADKLKGMTVNQLKAFITSPDGTTPEEIQDGDVQTESDEITVNDEKVMMEYFFTDASNIRKRISVAIDDVVPGLNKIQKNCADGTWNRYKLREFWASVPSEESDTSVRKGDQFRSYIEDLDHFLKIAHKRRARDIFTEENLGDINECRSVLKKFSKLCDKASKEIYIKDDVSMKEVSELAKMAMDSCLKIKKIVTTEQFAEFYYVEAMLVTKKNINNVLMAHLKETLGILNNTESNFPELVKSFKKSSKSLNKCLRKASRMHSMYSEDEIIEFTKLNKLLTDLSSGIRMNNLNDSYTVYIKKLIKDYSAQCKVVGEILKKHGAKDTPDTKESKKSKANKEPDTIKETDDLNINSTSTTTANTTIGSDAISSSVPSGTSAASMIDTAMPNTNTIQPAPTGVNDTSNVISTNECGATGCAPASDVTAKFNEFMSEY